MRISDWSSDVCSSDLIRRTARRPATMFSHDAKASRMRDRAADSLCVQPEFSAPAPRRKELPLHTALPRRLESATMQRHSPDPDSGQKPDSYDEAHYRALFRDAPYYSTGRNWRDYAPAYRYGHVARDEHPRSEEHTSELQSLMRTSYAVFCLKKKKQKKHNKTNTY